jgi:AAA domain
MPTSPHVLLITGPAGVGKSTLSWEIALQLQHAGVPYAAVDTDELDRVFPAPSGDPSKAALTGRNLRLLWSSFQALGHTRLILAGVMVDLDTDLTWVTDAIPGATLTIVRLTARDDTLARRVRTREIGSGHDAQLQRTLAQAARIATQRHDYRHDYVLLLATDGKTPTELARFVLRHTGWLQTDQTVPQVR